MTKEKSQIVKKRALKIKIKQTFLGVQEKEKLLDNGDRWENILDANIKADNIHR